MTTQVGDNFLAHFVADFASAMREVDAARPVASRHGEKAAFQPGIGPHPEDAVVAMCLEAMANLNPGRYADYQSSVPYSEKSRSRCDLCFGKPGRWTWAIEVKLLRFLGDNGKPNGNMLMHILSPYPQDRSALTDCTKLASAGLAPKCAVVIFGYEHQEWPLNPAIEAFETLARERVLLGNRISADTGSLVHPVHSSGRVFGWEVESSRSAES